MEAMEIMKTMKAMKTVPRWIEPMGIDVDSEECTQSKHNDYITDEERRHLISGLQNDQTKKLLFFR
jgi:hypothetical protein